MQVTTMRSNHLEGWREKGLVEGPPLLQAPRELLGRAEIHVHLLPPSLSLSRLDLWSRILSVTVGEVQLWCGSGGRCPVEVKGSEVGGGIKALEGGHGRRQAAAPAVWRQLVFSAVRCARCTGVRVTRGRLSCPALRPARTSAYRSWCCLFWPYFFPVCYWFLVGGPPRSERSQGTHHPVERHPIAFPTRLV
jgi:hypothetical protein